jgi:hypothetical protein
MICTRLPLMMGVPAEPRADWLKVWEVVAMEK